MKRHFCASVFVINPENKKILLIKHKKFKKWVQPGGHIEDDETPEEAALREVYEETGVRVKLLGTRFPREDDFIRPLGIQKNRGSNGDLHVDITYVGVPINRDQLTLNKEEATDIKWFSRSELDEIELFPDIRINMDYILRKHFGG
ncbi:MAG: NUDIX domain-containing protein [Bacilli bacterium]|nr:NUDIX domain-containing protein [Bacilli bacterium]MDD4733294.1 NUDIX domain-containing protein [Bacilli bacterium]